MVLVAAKFVAGYWRSSDNQTAAIKNRQQAGSMH